MKVAKNFIFNNFSENSGMKNWIKKVADMVKSFRQIDKGPMAGKPVVTPIDPDTLSFKEKS